MCATGWLFGQFFYADSNGLNVHEQSRSVRSYLEEVKSTFDDGLVPARPSVNSATEAPVGYLQRESHDNEIFEIDDIDAEVVIKRDLCNSVLDDMSDYAHECSGSISVLKRPRSVICEGEYGCSAVTGLASEVIIIQPDSCIEDCGVADTVSQEKIVVVKGGAILSEDEGPYPQTVIQTPNIVRIEMAPLD